MRINLSSESAVAEESDELCGSAADAPAPCMLTRTHTHVHKYTHNQIGLACVAEHAPVNTGAAIGYCKPRVLKRFKNYLHKELMYISTKETGMDVSTSNQRPFVPEQKSSSVSSILAYISLCVMTSYSIDHYTVCDVVFGHSREFVMVFSVDDYPSAVVETLCQFVKPYSFLSCRAGEQQRMTIKGSRVAKEHVGR